MKFIKNLTTLLVTVLCILFSNNDALAQMRQVYTDNTQPANEIFKLSFYTPAQGYVAFRDWIGYTTDSGRTFTKKYITLANVNLNGYSINSTFGFGIKGVKAFDQNNIIVYGDYGFVPAILQSSNGGAVYTLVYHSQFNAGELSTGITDMLFPENNNIGYAIDADRILKTTNQGVSWSLVRTDANSCFDHLDATDNNNVFAVSDYYTGDIQFPNNRIFANNKMLATGNGGSTWQTVAVPPGQVKNASFITPLTGWLHINEDLFYTENGGAGWVQKNNTTITPFNAKKIKFTNSTTGYALTGLFQVTKTTDAGTIWEPLERDNNYTYLGFSHNDFQLLTPTQLWAGGAHGFLEINTNATAATLPAAYFEADTTGAYLTNTVTLRNFSKTGYQYQWYVNDVLISTDYNSSYTHLVSSQEDIVKLVVVSGAYTDTLVKSQYFIVPNLPVITSFSPVSGSTGTFVTIYGSGFIGITSVKFGGVEAASFTVVAGNKITATVAAGNSGPVSVSVVQGSFAKPGFIYFATPATVPVVTSFTPASGPAGTTVTINGNNFGASLVNAAVYFGNARAGISAASPTQIICTVPPGAGFEPITVLNKSTGLTGESFKPFNLTFADSNYLTGNSAILGYNLPGPSDYNYSPKYVDGKDVDGDGKPDIIANIGNISAGDSIAVFRNLTAAPGDSLSFGPKINLAYTFKTGAGRFATGDLDGDGRPDIAGATNNATIPVVRNNSTPGNISFENAVILETPNGTHDIVIADIDNDGKRDIAIASYNNGKLTVIRNTSSPGYLSFAQRNDFNSGGNGVRLAVGDIDGDGKKDVVVLNYAATANFSYFLNVGSPGNIAFATRADIALPSVINQGMELAMADYDADNKLDVVVMTDTKIHIYRNTSTTGNIQFAAAISIDLPGTANGGCIANLSGDAKPDILAGNKDNTYVSMIRNISEPASILNDNFAQLYTLQRTENANAADFNMDGKMDIITSSGQDKKVRIFKNTMGVPIIKNYCLKDYIAVTSGIFGTNYQWQQDSGSGFLNIADTGNFTGTNTTNFTILATPSAWSGYKYRCLVDGKYSETFIIRLLPDIYDFSGTAPWKTAAWSCGRAPDANTDVIVKRGALIVNSNETIRSLKIYPGATVFVATGYKLTITH